MFNPYKKLPDVFAPDIGKQGSKPVQDGILRRPFPQDSQDRIVAGNGADNLNHGARIQERGHHTGMTGMGLQHRQVTGELHAKKLAEKITLCRNLLGCQKYLSQLRDKTVAEKIMILYKHDISKCSKCSGKMITYRVPGRYMLC